MDSSDGGIEEYILVSKEKFAEKLQFAGTARSGVGVAMNPPHPVSDVRRNVEVKVMIKAINGMRGSPGPDGVSAKLLRQCALHNGKDGINLATALADLATRLCCDNSILPSTVFNFMNARGITIRKPGGGYRPITIGNIAFRAMEKAIGITHGLECAWIGGADMLSCNQVGGISAGVNAIRERLANKDVDAVLSFDATNGFNSVCRHTAMHNLRRIAPVISNYAELRMLMHRRIYIGVDDNGIPQYLTNKEGVDQGDPIGMMLYSLALLPMKYHADDLVDLNCSEAEKQCFTSIFYADDGEAAGSLQALATWLKGIIDAGFNVGYFVNEVKTKLIVKKEMEVLAKDLFNFVPDLEFIVVDMDSDEPQGSHVLGCPIGNKAFEAQFIKEKVTEWRKLLIQLRKFASVCPQAAYMYYSSSLAQKWVYLARSVDGCMEWLHPLTEPLIDFMGTVTSGDPDFFRRDKNAMFIELLGLPLKFGGLGMPIPANEASPLFERQFSLVLSLKGNMLDPWRKYSPDSPGRYDYDKSK